MLNPQEALDRAHNLVSQAIKAGADAADAVYVCDASTEVQVRLGQLEDVARSEGEDIGLRVFVGQRSATISSSNMNPDILAGLVTRAIDMAKEAPEDQYAGLAPQDRLLTGPFRILMGMMALIPILPCCVLLRSNAKTPRAP